MHYSVFWGRRNSVSAGLAGALAACSGRGGSRVSDVAEIRLATEAPPQNADHGAPRLAVQYAADNYQLHVRRPSHDQFDRTALREWFVPRDQDAVPAPVPGLAGAGPDQVIGAPQMEKIELNREIITPARAPFRRRRRRPGRGRGGSWL